MYLQKCEGYFVSDENGELDKGIVCFMIERMKDSIPCDQVISRNNNAVSLRDELVECPDRIAVEQIFISHSKFV